jgi:hypothetical protein
LGFIVSKFYAVVSALIFAVVTLAHLIRISKRWTVQVGPFTVPMSVSWIGLVIAALLTIWGFMQLGGSHLQEPDSGVILE